MRRFIGMAASRRLPPAIFAVFLALYIAVAFTSDEALVTLMELTRRNVLLLGLFLLLPLHFATRLGQEIRHRLGAGGGPGDAPGHFDETVVARPENVAAAADWLQASGYRLRQQGDTLRAARGIALWPVRLLLLAGMFLLFVGIFLSLSMRQVAREVLIEGEQLPAPLHSAGKVAAIRLDEVRGLSLLARDLTIRLTDTGGEKWLGLYPPGRIAGRFLYPRYLGVAPRVVLSGPGLPPVSDYYLLMLYPPGREDTVTFPGSDLRIAFRLPITEEEDPYVTGAFGFAFRIVRGDEVVAAGVLPVGETFARGDLRLAIPDARRIVYADLVADPGLPLLWLALLLLPAAAGAGVLIRGIHPRREIVLVYRQGQVLACTRAEGKRLRHAGVFNETVDILEQERVGTKKARSG